MSSYNENLRSNVIASLQAQELELQKVKAKKNASMFTLYYAEAATLKASEELESTTDVFQKKMNVKTQAVDNSNISNNLLDSAGQASLYVKQSISNASVCAANVQLAANAIVRLASDLGSIYGIVNAADAKSDMYVLADESRKLINKTAYDAGLASQLAMELSILTSEVTASTVQDKAKANNDLMNSVLKIISDEFTAVSQLALAEDATLSSSSAAEKQAEGDYLDVTVDYKAAKAAYEATNQGLNLDLKVSGKTSTGFTVSFQPIRMPFQHLQSAAQTAINPYYPVKNYYVIVVKDAKKSTFSISKAEELLIATLAATATRPAAGNTTTTSLPSEINQKISILPIPMPLPVTDPSSTGDIQPIVSPLISQAINFQEMMIGDTGPFTLQDSDGDPVKLGVKYVVFVLALYTDDYKKKLNCFDDFLSAPSPSFTLKNSLAAVDGTSITIGPVQPANAVYDYLLNFTVKENPDYSDKVSYRCIFLPPNDPFAGYMLNKESTLALDQEVQLLEVIADQYDPKIAEKEATVVGLQNYITMLNSKLQSLNAENQQQQVNPPEGQIAGQKIDTEIDILTAQLNAQNIILSDEQQQLDSLKKERSEKVSQIKDGIQSGRVEFLFNLKIAEQVLAGNYIVATKNQSVTDADASSASGSKKAKSNTTATGPADNTDGEFPVVKWDIQVKSDVTDNFGNPLTPGTTYVPVVLSYCTATEENQPMFSNSWSGYAQSPNFLYQPTQS